LNSNVSLSLVPVESARLAVATTRLAVAMTRLAAAAARLAGACLASKQDWLAVVSDVSHLATARPHEPYFGLAEVSLIKKLQNETLTVIERVSLILGSLLSYFYISALAIVTRGKLTVPPLAARAFSISSASSIAFGLKEYKVTFCLLNTTLSRSLNF